MVEHKTLDVRGYTCPYPVFYTLKAMEELAAGDRLDVILDNPPSCEDIPISAKRRGYKVHGVVKLEETVWKITLEK